MKIFLVLLIVLFTSIEAYSETPHEYCKGHIELDEILNSAYERNDENRFNDFKYVLEVEKNTRIYGLANYLGCREMYEQYCKQFGKAEVLGWYSGTVQKQLDCSQFTTEK